jgi:hypothetical protein
MARGTFGLYLRTPELDGPTASVLTVVYDNLTLWQIGEEHRITEGPIPGEEPAPESTPTPPAEVTIENLPPVDWRPFEEEFDLLGIRIEEVLKPTMALPANFVVFEFEAAKDVGLVAYSAVFIDEMTRVRDVSGVEFTLDPAAPPELYDPAGGWNSGMYGTAQFQLPDDVLRYQSIRLVRDQ